MPRILVAGLFHETHTFLAERTDLAAFAEEGIHEGPALIGAALGNGSPMDGFLGVALAAGWDLVPSIAMAASPGGMVTADVMTRFTDRFFADLEREAARLDGVFLILHGAMVAEGCDDAEGMVLEGTRQRLDAAGRGAVPIVGVLDLHGNVGARMIDNSTVLTAYRENPHADARDTAVRAGHLLAKVLDRPGVVQRHRATGWILPPTGVGSGSDPMRAVLARARAIEAAEPDILCINVMAGYAYADIAECGFTLTGATWGDPARLDAALAELEGVLHDNAAGAWPREYSLDEALALADALPAGVGPVLLVEPADNIGGGTPGDGTGVLGPLLATGRTGIVAAINDPAAVAACRQAGLGTSIALPIGGRTDAHHGAPLPIAGRVRHLSDGRFELENHRSHLASMRGIHIEMGDCAVIETPQAVILLTSRKTPPMDLGQMHSQGIRPEDAALVVVKAAVSHRAAYDPIARASFNVDGPGLCTSALARLPYRHQSGKRIGPDLVLP